MPIVPKLPIAPNRLDDFGDRLRALREGYRSGPWPRGLLADRFGLAERALQDLEQGRARPSRTMILVVTAMEMDFDWMMEVATAAKDDLAALGPSRRGRRGAGHPQ